MESLPRIALVVPGLAEGGGVSVVGQFLFRVLGESGRYRPEMVSVAMSPSDGASVRVLSPATWLRGVRIERGVWEGLEFSHVGARWTELEFCRYRPRRVLTELLNEYALVQVVAGIPSWAMVARRVTPPVALQVATTAAEERKALLAGSSGLAGRWRRLMMRITSRLDLRALAHLDAAFVENAWMQEFLAERMEPSRVIFAPPGVDIEVFRPVDSGVAGDYILCVGRFSDRRKRVDLLFRAYHRLRATLPGAPRLVLAGSTGPSPSDWQLARSLGVADHVEFRERLPTSELTRLYREAAMFVLSSDEEGLGLVILEAMASGLPVVSTDCGGPSTSVVEGQTGFIVAKNDPDALASRMGELLQHSELSRTMGRAGRRRAEELFSTHAAARLFLDYYDRRLGRS